MLLFPPMSIELLQYFCSPDLLNELQEHAATAPFGNCEYDAFKCEQTGIEILSKISPNVYPFPLTLEG